MLNGTRRSTRQCFAQPEQHPEKHHRTERCEEPEDAAPVHHRQQRLADGWGKDRRRHEDDHHQRHDLRHRSPGVEVACGRDGDDPAAAGACPLKNARGDEHGKIGGVDAADAGNRVGRQRNKQDVPPAEAIRQRPVDQLRYAEADHVGDDNQLPVVFLSDPEPIAHLRQCRQHDVDGDRVCRHEHGGHRHEFRQGKLADGRWCGRLAGRVGRRKSAFVLALAGGSSEVWRPRVGGAEADLYVEAEMHDIAVLDDILLAFLPRLAGFLGPGLAVEPYVVAIGDGFRLDEALLEVPVDHASGLWRRRALADRPGAGLLWADCEVGKQPQQVVSGLDDAVEARFLKAETVQELLFLFVAEDCDFALDLCRDDNRL